MKRIDRKEGVDGSSPSEGFSETPAQITVAFAAVATGGVCGLHAASTIVHRCSSDALRASSNGVRARARRGRGGRVAVDHGQAGAHVAGEIEGGDAGTEREGGEGVPKIVDPAVRGSMPAASCAGFHSRLRKLCRSR